MLVLVYHAGYLTAGWGPRLLPGGFIGVDLFFVLSGFLITRILVAEVERTGGIDVRRFAVRRVRRLVPVLAVAVAGTLTALALLGTLPPLVDTATIAGGTLGYVSNYQQAAGWVYVPELSHTWSLAIEGQFYLFWPLVILVLARLRVPRWAWVVLLGAAMVVVWVHRASMWTDQAHYLPLYLRTDTRIDVILAGCVLGLLAAWGWLRPAHSRWLRVAAAAGIAVLVVVSLFSETGDVHLYRDYGLVAVTLGAAALVASVLVDPHWLVNRSLDWAPLGWLGDRSYSLYLWHVPVFLTIARHLGDWPILVKVAFGVAITFALTELSYALVEQRFRARRTDVA